MKLYTTTLVMALFLALACPAKAHFGLVIPSHSTVMEKKDAKLAFEIAFCHPFNQSGMSMERPMEFFVTSNGKKYDLSASLQPATYLGKKSWKATYEIKTPGVYSFGVKPQPYFEAAEECFIIHYAKTVIGAYGAEEGWDKPIGLPVEIVPFLRPFANYAGNVFRGQVIKNGKPAVGIPVEVEYLNNKNSFSAPDAYFETQVVMTDNNGIFSFGIPWAGWWGFAALTQGTPMPDKNGQPRDVELGSILWMQFAAPANGK